MTTFLSHPGELKNNKILKILLNASLVMSSMWSSAYTFVRLQSYPRETMCDALESLSADCIASLLLILPLITFGAALAISIKARRIRWFFYGLSLVALQIAFGMLQLMQFSQ